MLRTTPHARPDGPAPMPVLSSTIDVRAGARARAPRAPAPGARRWTGRGRRRRSPRTAALGNRQRTLRRVDHFSSRAGHTQNSVPCGSAITVHRSRQAAVSSTLAQATVAPRPVSRSTSASGSSHAQVEVDGCLARRHGVDPLDQQARARVAVGGAEHHVRLAPRDSRRTRAPGPERRRRVGVHRVDRDLDSPRRVTCGAPGRPVPPARACVARSPRRTSARCRASARRPATPRGAPTGRPARTPAHPGISTASTTPSGAHATASQPLAQPVDRPGGGSCPRPPRSPRCAASSRPRRDVHRVRRVRRPRRPRERRVHQRPPLVPLRPGVLERRRPGTPPGRRRASRRSATFRTWHPRHTPSTGTPAATASRA